MFPYCVRKPGCPPPLYGKEILNVDPTRLNCNKILVNKYKMLVSKIMRINTIEMCIDEIQKDEVFPLSLVISDLSKVPSLCLWSEKTSGRKHGNKYEHLSNPKKCSRECCQKHNFTESEILSEYASRKISLNPALNGRLIRGVANNMAKSKSLKVFELRGMALGEDSCLVISKGIRANKGITKFSMTHIVMPGNSLECILIALAKHLKVTNINLSHNSITGETGAMIKKVIVCHAERRDLKVWAASLRNEPPPANYWKQGLSLFTLSHNKLGDDFVHSLGNSINYDNYLGVLDLSHNKISRSGVLNLLQMLRENEGLVNLDLRGNPGYSSMLHKSLVLNLLKNIDGLKKVPDKFIYSMEQNWINRNLLEINIPHKVWVNIQEKLSQVQKIHKSNRSKKIISGSISETNSPIKKGISHRNNKNWNEYPQTPPKNVEVLSLNIEDLKSTPSTQQTPAPSTRAGTSRGACSSVKGARKKRRAASRPQTARAIRGHNLHAENAWGEEGAYMDYGEEPTPTKVYPSDAWTPSPITHFLPSNSFDPKVYYLNDHSDSTPLDSGNVGNQMQREDHGKFESPLSIGLFGGERKQSAPCIRDIQRENMGNINLGIVRSRSFSHLAQFSPRRKENSIFDTNEVLGNLSECESNELRFLSTALVSFSPNRGEGPKVYQGKQVQSPCENCRELERQVYLAESRSLGFAMQNMNLRRELANYLLTSTPLKSDQPVSSLMSKGEGEGTNTDIALSNIPYSHTGVPNQATKYEMGGTGEEEGEVRQRIDLLITELTRLMDSLEGGSQTQLHAIIPSVPLNGLTHTNSLSRKNYNYIHERAQTTRLNSNGVHTSQQFTPSTVPALNYNNF